MAGMYSRWRKQREKENPIVNAELLDLFKNCTEEQSAELNATLPAMLKRSIQGEC
jgi:hypothetical protein